MGDSRPEGAPDLSRVTRLEFTRCLACLGECWTLAEASNADGGPLLFDYLGDDQAGGPMLRPHTCLRGPDADH